MKGAERRRPSAAAASATAAASAAILFAVAIAAATSAASATAALVFCGDEDDAQGIADSIGRGIAALREEGIIHEDSRQGTCPLFCEKGCDRLIALEGLRLFCHGVIGDGEAGLEEGIEDCRHAQELGVDIRGGGVGEAALGRVEHFDEGHEDLLQGYGHPEKCRG